MGTKNMAAEMNTVVEGSLKFRDGKKWKPRYCVIKKPSPVADRLLVSMYKDVKDVAHNQPKTTFLVEDYFGIEADLTVDKENCVMALICQKSVSIFAFDHREGMLHFEISIRSSLGQDLQYPVRLFKIPTHSKLPLGMAQLHIQGQKFCLTAHSPPKVLMSWKIPELRRYGIVDGRFMFEGGSMCGKGSGVHGFESYQVEEINRNFQSSGRFPIRKPLMWRRNKSQEQHLDQDRHGPEFRKIGNMEQELRVQERMRSKRHSVGVLDYRQAVDFLEKKRLMSIENVDQERFTRLYDIPPQLVRKVDSDPRIPESGLEELSAQERLADISNKNLADNIPSGRSTGDRNRANRNSDTGNRSNRNSGDGSRSNRNSGDGTRSNRNSGDGTRSNRNSGDGTRSNRNSEDGMRSNRNSGDGMRSNRNSEDGTRSNRNSGDGTRSNRNSGDGRRSKRNSADGSRSNRNSSDSSQSSRSSGEGTRYRPRRYSGETGHSYWHSDIAHRTSLALRRSLDNILAGNQNWVDDIDGEFKENSLSRSNLYKSTSALCSRLSESDSVLIEDEVVHARSGSVLLSEEAGGQEEQALGSPSRVGEDTDWTPTAVDPGTGKTPPKNMTEDIDDVSVEVGEAVQSVCSVEEQTLPAHTSKQTLLAQTDTVVESQNEADKSQTDSVFLDDGENQIGSTLQDEGAQTQHSIGVTETISHQPDSLSQDAPDILSQTDIIFLENQPPSVSCVDDKSVAVPSVIQTDSTVLPAQAGNALAESSASCEILPDNEIPVQSSNTVLNQDTVQAVFAEVPYLLPSDGNTGQPEGNPQLEELTHQEEILQHEMDLLDEMLQVCVDDRDDDGPLPKSRMSQGFADALSTLTIDTCWSEEGSDSSPRERSNSSCGHVDSMGAMLSPNLTSKISRIPSCSKLVAPLPYVNLDKYDLGFRTSDHVDVSQVPLVRRGLSYDNLMSASKPSSERHSFRTKSLSCSDSSGSSVSLSPYVFTRRDPPPLPPKTLKEESPPPPKLPPKGPNLLRRQKGTSGLFNFQMEDGQSRLKPAKPAVLRPGQSGEANPQYQTPHPVPTRVTKPAALRPGQYGEANPQYQTPRPVPTRVSKPAMLRPGQSGEANPQYQTPLPVPTRVSKPTPPLPEPDEPYMLMSEFVPKAVSPSRPVFTCPTLEELQEDDPKSPYMDMSTIMDVPPPLLPKCSSGPEIHRLTKVPPKVARSQSVRTALEESRKPKLSHSYSAEIHENYIKMAAPEPAEGSQNCLRTGDQDAKAAMPFPDLITVQSYRSNQKIELSGVGESNSNNSKSATLNNSGTDKLDSSSGSNKSLSFFSRFIQRTKNRKASLSSSDSSTDLGKTEPSVSKTKSDVTLCVPVVTNRSASISYENDANLLAPPDGADRKRSSSFPNEAVFLENVKGEDKHESIRSRKGKEKMDKRGSQSEDTLLSLIEKDTKKKPNEAFSPYWNMAPLEITCTSSCNESKQSKASEEDKINLHSSGNANLSEQKDISQTANALEGDQVDISDSLSKKLKITSAIDKIPSAMILESGKPCVSGTDSLLPDNDVSRQIPTTDHLGPSPQTNDEKLLSPAKGSKEVSVSSAMDSIPPNITGTEGKLTASEQAAAIAEYVTALAPFIPPKTKLPYPGGLSPVIEGLASPPSDPRPLTGAGAGNTDPQLTKAHSHAEQGKGKERLSDAASRKRKARETLRIMPPIEDENGNIWIPRGSLRKSEAVNGHGVSGEDGMNTASRRNDAVNEVKEHLDGLSLSSHSSTAGSPGHRADDTPLRSSPASTTLRPRSGKEYHRIDRRRLADDHSPSSCPITPQSPSTGSIFTFDTPSSPSIRSILSRDGESPVSSPSIMRGPYPCHSYVNLGKGADNRPNLYVNIDMTPPNSPFRRTHMPLEQIDPQLNYAEIDLSQAGSDRSRKAKKGVQKAATIEYAMIDMVATAAVSKTRKEQDSLRCSGRKFSAPASVIVKERRTLGGGSFREKDRGRKLSTSSVDSNG